MEYKKLTEICNPKQWKTIPKGKLLTIGYPVYGANGIIGYYNEFNHEKETILITCRGASCGSINLSSPKSYITGNAMCLDDLSSIVNVEYLYYYLKNYNFNKVISGSAQPQITRENLKKVDVMIYPLKKQKIIVNILKKIENIHQIKIRILNKFDELVKARFVEMFGDPLSGKYKTDYIKNIGKIISGATPKTNVDKYWDGNIKWITPAEIDDNTFFINDSIRHITKEGYDSCGTVIMPVGTVILSSRAPIGKVAILSEKMCCNQGFKNIIPNERINSIYLYWVLKQSNQYLNSLGRGATFKEISKQIVENIKITIPPINLQNKFADFVKQVDKSKFIFEPTLFINFPML